MDWEAVENIWDYALKNRLYADPYDHPIIMPEPVYNTKARREKMTQLMFERFSVPAYYLAKDPVLTAFSQGKQNALVVDIGSGKTCVVPVHEGYVLQNPSRKTKVAGDSLDALVYRQVLQTKGVRNVPCNYEYSKSMNRDGTLTSTRKQLPGPVTDSYRAYMQQAVIRDLKESLCRVHEQPFSEHLYAQLPRKPFVLPDGNVVDVGVERIMVGEALFNANLGLGSEVTVDLHPQQTFSGLHKMVCESIDACDVDIRRDLYSNIILGGGGSVMPGLQARLQLEVTTVIPHGIKCKVHTPATNAETRFASWIGGSVLASLGTFHQMWISRAEYEEFGAGILLRKCP
jgi:actin-like protein 6A